MIYNHYIHKHYFLLHGATGSGQVSKYRSKVYFLGLNRDYVDCAKKYNLIYVNFSKPYSNLSGFYLKSAFSDRLMVKWVQDEKREYPKYITNWGRSTVYFTNIKIIEDIQNPDLNGKVMLFKMNENLFRNLAGNFKFDNVYEIVGTLKPKENFSWNVSKFIEYNINFTDEKIPVKNFTDQEIPIDFNYRVFSEEFYNSLVNRKSLNTKLKKLKTV